MTLNSTQLNSTESQSIVVGGGTLYCLCEARSKTLQLDVDGCTEFRWHCVTTGWAKL